MLGLLNAVTLVSLEKWHFLQKQFQNIDLEYVSIKIRRIIDEEPVERIQSKQGLISTANFREERLEDTNEPMTGLAKLTHKKVALRPVLYH